MKNVFRYSEIADTKDFFNAAKKSARMVVHFYRSVTPRCEIVDAHLSKLAFRYSDASIKDFVGTFTPLTVLELKSHLETRFIKIDAEKNPFLVERLGIILMPTIVLIKDGKTEHSLRLKLYTFFIYITV